MPEATYVYQYDPTGVLESNYITEEEHTLAPGGEGDYNFIIPKAAPFFETGLIIRHKTSNAILIRGLDYYLSHRFIAAEEVTPEPVYGSITFVDSKLGGTVEITYRTMGGPYSLNEHELATYLANKRYDPRTKVWGVDIIVPTEFPSADHPTDAEDLVGMDEFVASVDNMADAIRNTRNGDPIVRMEHIVGLEEALFNRVRQDGSRKYAMSAPVAIVDYSAPIHIHLPNWLNDTDLNVKLTIVDENGVADLSFHGRAPGINGDRSVDTWPLTGIIPKGYLSDRTITYEAKMGVDNIPYIAVSVGRLQNAAVLVSEATINTTFARAYNDGWAVSLPGGSDIVFSQRFDVPTDALQIDFSQLGTLVPNTQWMVDASEPRSRALPITPPDDTVIKVKDNSNLATINPATITGRVRINGVVHTEVLLDESSGWFSLQYVVDGDYWVITEGA